MVTAVPLPHTRWALFLDVDGTLLELAPTPDAVRVPARVKSLLAGLVEAAEGAVALVSGRTIAQLDNWFAPLKLASAGLHGLERRDADGKVHRPPHDARALQRARTFLAGRVKSQPALLLEDKQMALALHYRRAPELEATARAAIARAREIAGEGYCVLEGKMVLELKPDGFSKPLAIAAFLAEPPFAGRTPLFVGDDRTDEAGLTFVEGLGGIAVHVGDSDTSARWQLANVSAVHEWLAALLLAQPGSRSAAH
jgi:trehalose 6-phosphate phosphatase